MLIGCTLHSISYFARVGLKAVCSLSVDQPFLTNDLFHTSFASLVGGINKLTYYFYVLEHFRFLGMLCC